MSSPLDAVPGGVLTLSEDLRILAANKALADLVGRAQPQLLGEPFDVLLSPPARILFQTHVYPALRADGQVQEVFLTLATGSAPMPILFNAVRRTGPDGTTYDGLIVRIDARSRWETDLLAATRAIAEERSASERLARDLAATMDELAARHAEERRASEFRDAFVGILGHELRTPITTIFGMSHFLRDRYESLDSRTTGQYLADIASEADRLRRLAEDLLVLSRAETGRLVVASEPIVVEHIVEAAVRGEAALATDHEFALEVRRPLPIVMGETGHVEQVTRNILANAAKYSPRETTIRTVVTAEDGGVAVRIIDAGPGLGGQDPAKLFEPFFRTVEAAQKASGAGIGLFISRELMQAMNGRLWAAPAPSPAATGSEFGYWLPAVSDLGSSDGS